jgi:hypothetical protein
MLIQEDIDNYWEDFYKSLNNSFEEKLRNMLSSELGLCSYTDAVNIVHNLSQLELVECKNWFNSFDLLTEEEIPELPNCLNQFF